MALRWDETPSAVKAQMPGVSSTKVVMYVAGMTPDESAICWKVGPYTAWSASVTYTPTFSPGRKPWPSVMVNRVPPRAHLGTTVALILAGMLEHGSAGTPVAVGAGRVGVGGVTGLVGGGTT